jgi:dextranase
MKTPALYPGKAQYKPGEDVILLIRGLSKQKSYRLEILYLDTKIAQIEVSPAAAETKISLGSDYPAEKGFAVFLISLNDDAVLSSTAFDVAESWKTAPRYGFLSGFSSDEACDLADIESLSAYHLNVIQFYDWMYRHEELLPPADEYKDPLGRPLSRKVVLEKAAACRKHGMAALAYAAVYGASRNFAEEHPEWGLYTVDGRPASLGGWLSIQDISPGSPWRSHICRQFRKTLKEMPFDGFHLDSYGTPKRAYSKKIDQAGEKRLSLHRLEYEFPSFVDEVRSALSPVCEDPGLIFNCVNNWPVRQIARSSTDALYIEVWPPHTDYQHLYHIIREARLLSNKPIICAAYLSPFADIEGGSATDSAEAENALALAYAVINSSGAFHLIFGEKGGVLQDPYYVNHYLLSDTGYERFRRYADFIVKYRCLLYGPFVKDLTLPFSGSDGDDFVFSGAPSSSFPVHGNVWPHIAETDEHIVISFVNFTNLETSLWNTAQKQPEQVSSLTVRALVPEGVASVHSDSPDGLPSRPQRIAWKTEPSEKGPVTVFSVPNIDFWRIVYIRKKI